MPWPALRPFGRTKSAGTGDPDPFVALRHEMDHLFDHFGRGYGWPTARAGALSPSIDVSETDAELKVDVELPGIDEQDVEVTIADNVLTVKGEKKEERKEDKSDYHLLERYHGAFARSLTLPFSVSPDAAKANFKNRVLTITLPKPPEVEAKAARIAIGSA